MPNEETTGQEPKPEAQESQPAKAPWGEDFDAERAWSTIQNLRQYEKRSAQLEKKVAAMEEAEAERKRSEMSELDRLRADLEAATEARQAAEAKAQRTAVQSQVVAAAASAGMHDPSDAMAHIGQSVLEGADVQEALDTLKSSKPYLFKSSTPAVSPTNPTGGKAKPSKEQLLREIYGGGGQSFEGGGVFWGGKEP